MTGRQRPPDAGAGEGGAERDGALVQSVVRAFRVLDALAEGGAGVSDVARSTGLHKATVHRLLRTLHHLGMVEVAQPGGRYRLGLRLMEMGGRALQRLDWREVTRPYLAELRDRTTLTVHMGILERDEVVYVEKFDSPANLRMASFVGSRRPAYCTALGKAMLSAMPAAEVDAVLAATRFVPRTANTITDPLALRDDLLETARRGYAVDDVENEEGIRCVAAPIFGSGGKVLGGVSVSGPVFSVPLERVPRLGETVRDAARRMSEALGHAGDRR